MKNEPHFQLMADSAPVMIWITDTDKRATFFNRSWLDFTGRTLADELGYGWVTGIYPDDLNRYMAVFSEAFDAHAPFSIEYRLRRYDGEYRTVLENGMCWFDEIGNFSGFIGSSIDISPRKQVENVLLAGEKLLRRENAYLTALHETTLGIVNRLDWSTLLEALVIRACDLIETPHGFIDIVLPTENCLELQVGVGIYTRFIGYRKKMGEGLAGQVWNTQEPLIVNDYRGWPGHSEQFLVGEFHSVIGAPLLSGSQVIGVIGLSRIEPGAIFSQEQLNLLMHFADLASIALDNARLYKQVRHHAEALEQRVLERTKELDLQKRQSEIILQNAIDAIVFTDLQGKILYVNPAWERLTGYLSDEVLGNNPRILQSGVTATHVYQEMWQTILSGKTWHGVMHNKRKSGTHYDAELTIVPVPDTTESIQYFVGVQRDVTEMLKLQEQQRRFVANAAHDLRTPLTNFKTRLYLARRQPEKFVDHIDILDRAANHMAALVTDLLDLSRFETGLISLHKERIELKLLITRVLEMVQPHADSKNISIAMALPGRALPFMADPVRIQQVLTNLLANAIHYTDEGGHIQINVGLDNNPDRPLVIIEIEDNGVGISPEHLHYIFQPFYRVNDQKVGTGLGLSIAKEIIERHEGEISVTSAKGIGTHFTIKLPVLSHVN